MEMIIEDHFPLLRSPFPFHLFDILSTFTQMAERFVLALYSVGRYIRRLCRRRRRISLQSPVR